MPSHPYSSTLMQMATFQSTGRNLRNLTDTCLYRDTSFTVVPSELPSRVCKIFHMAHTYMVIHTYCRKHIYIYSQKLVLTLTSISHCKLKRFKSKRFQPNPFKITPTNGIGLRILFTVFKKSLLSYVDRRENRL